ncbi:MAG: LysR family transcriptional regulator [Nitrospinota bacterium]|nr:LysR family transcriptional regulator [Nitrospinota bacterium]
MIWLNYQRLQYFQMVAQEGSIARASEKLNLGQPAISIQIKHLEEEVGCDLFERRNRRLVLTQAGQVALEYANQIFNLGNELTEVLEAGSFLRKVHLNIGALDSIPKTVIQNLTDAAFLWGPCTVTVLEGTGDLLFRELLAHKIDLVVADYQPDVGDSRRFFIRSLGHHPISIFGARSFRRLIKGFPESLQGQPFLLPTFHSKRRHDLDHYFRANQINIEVVMETQDTSVQKLMAVRGNGLVALPRFAGQSFIKGEKMLELGNLEGVYEDLYLVSSPRTIANPLADHLMSYKLPDFE